MAVVIKPKKSETASSAPTTSNLAVGEIAVNTADKKIYIRDSNDNIVTLAQYGEFDESLVFPTGDLGDLTALSEDAFGQLTDKIYDCKGDHSVVTPSIKFRTATVDFGSVAQVCYLKRLGENNANTGTMEKRNNYTK